MRKIIGTIIIIVSLYGCSDFLEPKSQSEYSPTDISHLDEVLLGVAYPGPQGGTNFNMMNCMLEVMSDNVSNAGVHSAAVDRGFYTVSTNVRAAKVLYTWQPDYTRKIEDIGGSQYWKAYQNIYHYISGANAVLDQIDEVDGNREEKDYVLAQAYALRGFLYLHLVNMYGEPYYYNPQGLAVPLKLTSDVEERKLTRNTVEEVYDQIVKDLLEAERLFKELPEDKQFRKNYRANLPMTQHLLARTYLYMEKWEEASLYAETLMERTDFTLMNLESLVNSGYTNAVSGLNRKFYNFITYDNPECYWVFGSASDISFYNKIIIDRNGTFGCAYLLQASADLVSSFKDGDARKLLYMVNDYYNNAINITKYGSIGKLDIAAGAYNVQPSTGVSDFGQALRKAEAYLICAEANAMLYKTKGDAAAATKAISALNELRSKRFLANRYVAVGTGDFTTPDELVEFAREERRRELCFEALRWFDQRRYGMKKVERNWYIGTTTGISSYERYVLEENDPAFTLAIPHTDLENNTDLVQESVEGKERVPAETVGE